MAGIFGSCRSVMLPSPSPACQQRGKGLQGGLFLLQTIPRAKKKIKKQGENVTGRHSPPLQSLPSPGSRAQSLLLAPRIAVYYYRREKKKQQPGRVWSAHPDFLPPALFLFSPLKKELYPLTLPCPGLARNPQHLGARRQPTSAAGGAGRRPGPAR